MQRTLPLQPCAPPTLCEQVAAEEVFEALALYFPIAFTPPPNDPHRITEQHLLQALLRTLRASRHFGPRALAFFGSKLHAAEEQPTKMQARATLASRTPVAAGRAQPAPPHTSRARPPIRFRFLTFPISNI